MPSVILSPIQKTIISQNSSSTVIGDSSYSLRSGMLSREMKSMQLLKFDFSELHTGITINRAIITLRVGGVSSGNIGGESVYLNFRKLGWAYNWDKTTLTWSKFKEEYGDQPYNLRNAHNVAVYNDKYIENEDITPLIIDMFANGINTFGLCASNSNASPGENSIYIYSSDSVYGTVKLEVFYDFKTSNPPTNLQPAGITVNATNEISCTWNFSSNIAGDVQTGYELAYSQDATNWSSVSRDAATQSHIFAANTFKAGEVHFRVRTKNMYNVFGNWSYVATFKTSTKPPVPVLSNIDNTTSQPYVRWSSEQQEAYQVNVMDNSSVYYDSGEIIATTKEHKITKNLANNKTYIVKIRVKNSFNIWSDWAEKTITTNISAPQSPIISVMPNQVRGSGVIMVKNPHALNLFELFENGTVYYQNKFCHTIKDDDITHVINASYSVVLRFNKEIFKKFNSDCSTASIGEYTYKAWLSTSDDIGHFHYVSEDNALAIAYPVGTTIETIRNDLRGKIIAFKTKTWLHPTATFDVNMQDGSLSKITIDAQVKSLGQNRDASDCIEKIEGRTLFNLVRDPVKNASEWVKADTINGTVEVVGDIVSCTNNTTSNWARYASTTACSEITNNKHYVMIVDVKSTNGKISFYNDRITSSKAMPTIPIDKWTTVVIKGTGSVTNQNKWLVLGTDGIGTVEYNLRTLRIYEIAKEEYDALSEQQLLEKYPYVEGIQSARDFEIVSVGENLIDTNNADNNKMFWLATNTPEFADGFFLTNPIYVEPNMKLTSNSECTFFSDINWGHCYDGNKSFKASGKTITIPSHVKGYCRFSMHKAVVSMEGMSISYGDTIKQFKPYHKSTILSSESFPNHFKDKDKEYRSIGNIKDEIVKTAEGFEFRRKVERVDIREGFSFQDHIHSKLAKTIECVIMDAPPNSGLNGAPEKHIAVSYNGVKLPAYQSDVSHKTWITQHHVRIMLPNNLTGWGDSYRPTVEEIKAYWLGWTMSTQELGLYEGTGVKVWRKLWSGVGEKVAIHGVDVVVNSHTSTLPTTLNDMGFTPYQLLYEKETPEVYNLLDTTEYNKICRRLKGEQTWKEVGRCELNSSYDDIGIEFNKDNEYMVRTYNKNNVYSESAIEKLKVEERSKSKLYRLDTKADIDIKWNTEKQVSYNRDKSLRLFAGRIAPCVEFGEQKYRNLNISYDVAIEDIDKHIELITANSILLFKDFDKKLYCGVDGEPTWQKKNRKMYTVSFSAVEIDYKEGE